MHRFIIFIMGNAIAASALANDSEVMALPRATVAPTGNEHDEIMNLAELIRPVWNAAGSKRAMARAAGFTQYGGSAANKIDAAIAWLEQRYATATTSTPSRSTVAALFAE
jgi:hypothetical protein